ncbi:Fibronectin type III domain protein [compost metagenome]
MKILVSLLVFAFTLALTAPAVAAGGGHGDLTERMNALFPPKQADISKGHAPAKPELVSPAYFSVVSSDKLPLQWKAVEGADQYHLQVATDANFKWLVANEYFLKDTTFEVNGLEAGKHYFWRVAAVKSDNASTHRTSFFAASMFATAETVAK